MGAVFLRLWEVFGILRGLQLEHGPESFPVFSEKTRLAASGRNWNRNESSDRRLSPRARYPAHLISLLKENLSLISIRESNLSDWRRSQGEKLHRRRSSGESFLSLCRKWSWRSWISAFDSHLYGRRHRSPLKRKRFSERSSTPSKTCTSNEVPGSQCS